MTECKFVCMFICNIIYIYITKKKNIIFIHSKHKTKNNHNIRLNIYNSPIITSLIVYTFCKPKSKS